MSSVLPYVEQKPTYTYNYYFWRGLYIHTYIHTYIDIHTYINLHTVLTLLLLTHRNG